MKTANMITILTCIPNTEACMHCPAQRDCITTFYSPDFNRQVAQRLSDLLTVLDKTRKQLQEAKLKGREREKEYNRLVHDIQKLTHEHQIVED